MSKIYLGTGSEWHMLRMLGRHREWFTRQVLEVIGGPAIEWLDFKPTGSLGMNHGDAETKGLDFLPDGHPVRIGWSS